MGNTDAVDGGVLTLGTWDILAIAAVVFFVTKIVRRLTGAPTARTPQPTRPKTA